MKEKRIIQKLCILSLAMVMLLSATNPTQVYAAQDDNLTGNDKGPGGATSGDVVIANNPTQGARTTVVDITQGNKVIGSVNFLQAEPRNSTFQPMMFNSHKDWKLKASNTLADGHLDAVYDPAVPKDNMSKEAWGTNKKTLKKIAAELNMKYMESPTATYTPDI